MRTKQNQQGQDNKGVQKESTRGQKRTKANEAKGDITKQTEQTRTTEQNEDKRTKEGNKGPYDHMRTKENKENKRGRKTTQPKHNN
jgi:hypothetical protein